MTDEPTHVRFAHASSQALAWLDTAVEIVDEERELSPAASAAHEAALACIVAMVRAELSDPWWAGRSPDPSEVFVERSPAELITEMIP